MPKQPQYQTHTGQGSQSFSIGWEDFIKGVSATDKVSDAGLSPNSYNINLLSQVGELSSTAAPVAGSTSGTYNGFVATCSDVTIGGTAGNAVRAVTTTGEFYTGTRAFAWTTPTKDAANTYAYAFSDLVSFNGNYFASSHNASLNDNVCKWDGATTHTDTWFSSNFTTSHSNYLTGNCPHPMLVFNERLYIADGNKLHAYSEPGGTPTFTSAVLTIDVDAVIYSLAIDPSSGRMMVGYSQVWQNAVYPSRSNIGLYDGTNPRQFVKLVPLDDVPRLMYSVGGTVYVGYGDTLGIWNGSGVTFLRQLVGNILKQQFTNIGNNVYFTDNGYIWCYTELKGLSNKVFFPLLKNPDSGRGIQVIFNHDNQSMIGYSESDVSLAYHFYKLDVNAVGAQSQTAIAYSNWYYFPRPIYVRAIDITMEGLLTSSDTITPSINDDQNNNIAFNPSNISSTNTVQTNRLSTDTNPTTSAQFVLVMQTSIPFKRAIVYYDPAE